MDQEILFEDVKRFIAKYGMSESAFGVMAAHTSDLIFQWRNGRKSRPATLAKIRERMAAFELEQSRQDEMIVDSVEEAGKIVVESDGKPYVNGAELPQSTLHRLEEAGKIIPSDDSMFGVVSQTYVVNRGP